VHISLICTEVVQLCFYKTRLLSKNRPLQRYQ